MKNQIFIPTVAEFKDDISTSLDVQAPLANAGYKPGLMLVIRGGRRGVALDSIVRKQYSNLERIKEQYGDSPVVTMLSNLPIEEIDFLHNPNYATEHVKRGVDFARSLPIGGGNRKILTFHLNSLVSEDEFKEKNEEVWENEFHKIIRPALQEIAKYSGPQDKYEYGSDIINVKIETVPVPEFGDIPSDDKGTYRGVKLNELRNPFYLTGEWGFEQIHDAGLGICLDLCHNRTIYRVAGEGDSDEVLHKSDRDKLAGRTLFNDVLELESYDLVHLNDGDGIYSKKNGTVFKEGVPLGQGDIAELRESIRHLDENKIPYVLEINETDFKNRPGAKASIDYLLQKK